MKKPVERHERSNQIAKDKHENPKRMARFGFIFARKNLMDIAIQACAYLAALMALIMAVVSASSWQASAKFSVTLWLGFTAAVLGLLAGSLYWQKQHWENEAKAAAESAATDRPELFIEQARMLPLVLSKPQTIILAVRNRGNQPARNIKLAAGNTILKPKDFSGPLIYNHGEGDTAADLAADAEAVIAVKVPIEMTEERIEQLNNENLLYFHYGTGTYENESGRTYALDFCFMYTPLAPTIMRTCPTRYWPQENSENKNQS